ncbi:MAG: UDP-3-O-acyl-N-acetylglucosamine deacetylase [Cognatishimia sp.]|uniref:UDP-3-O-acyl-N-acetylglucosamine deacetylase n=1 Tax=Cognatishimia sp. 1_MG-2023 TaxID=3062642 RepID=UPI0026E399CE|nr:UDP-3-O-acyl-N-acetylglucosamine deacetylase [Cognatishimia sp. 1_MG-2023]MDO6725626.1 UDP-3-O-acyl-N-acetylglucosamine deacetylase [Cognatishimia sp. 1_MG-2023]
MQNTIKSSIRFVGVGLHSGKPVRMTLEPASAGYGIWFQRTDLLEGDQMLPARWDIVEQSPLCTKLVNASGVSVSTIEHIMAALAGCGVHNVLIRIDGPEVPIMDGSSAAFVKSILACGLANQGQPIRAIQVLKSVRVERDDAWAELHPAENLEIDFQIDFDDEAIGVQHRVLNMANGSFVRELSNCRTFCRRADVEYMQSHGLALGGIPGENAIVFDGARIESGELGLRQTDEPVRHKMLDALGDLYTAGAPILGRYVGHRSGHAMTNKLLRALLSDPTAYKFIECSPETAARLPGAGVRMAEMPAVA